MLGFCSSFIPPFSELSFGICNVLFALPVSGTTGLGDSEVFVVTNFSDLGSAAMTTDSVSGAFLAIMGSSLLFF